jgi:hypothetical protein
MSTGSRCGKLLGRDLEEFANAFVRGRPSYESDAERLAVDYRAQDETRSRVEGGDTARQHGDAAAGCGKLHGSLDACGTSIRFEWALAFQVTQPQPTLAGQAMVRREDRDFGLGAERHAEQAVVIERLTYHGDVCATVSHRVGALVPDEFDQGDIELRRDLADRGHGRRDAQTGSEADDQALESTSRFMRVTDDGRRRRKQAATFVSKSLAGRGE